MKTLYTVGYASSTLPEFVHGLRSEGIGVVLDVRDKPISRKPGFSKRALGEGLETAGIRYEHAGFAGNPKTLPDAARSIPDALARFEKHLDRHPEILDRLSDLIAAHQRGGRRVTLLCLERDPAECHRAVLARRWAATRGRKVVHLGMEE